MPGKTPGAFADFEAWRPAPLAQQSPDSRFIVRWTVPTEFEGPGERAITDLDNWFFSAGDIDTL